MRKLLAWLLIFLALGSAFLAVSVRADGDAAAADDDDDGEDVPAAATRAAEPEDDGDETAVEETEEQTELKPSADISAVVLFPEYPDKKIPLGEKITLLVSFKNQGPQYFNVTGITAFFHSPFDFQYYIQNFTTKDLGQIVGPNQEASLEYIFLPDKSLEPTEFHLSAYVDYNSSMGIAYRTTFTNGTIELIEKPLEFNAKSFFSYFLGAAAVALVAYFFLGASKSVSKPSAAVERGTKGDAPASADAADSDWAGKTYKPKAASVAVGRKRSKKPSASSPKASESS